ncbi:FtsX-like permease family protein [Clostridium sp. BNL1100]|uniref:ABC transporter permease n=1 Tax=Clostridium sp. BNL1100 TaxID=755731 RepID=UPI00024A7DE5|nr:FtsX-like permease family protein [Clostridium sp. BNL1100]AEY65813.1 ABC-type transport system, involved in lipoprotein release, permease component [Clostridium sp. BNL1100]
MMFPTDNKLVIKKLTVRTIKANKVRNIFVITAIALTALLLSTIFSIGISGTESIQLQKIRTMGTIEHGGLTFPTDEQVKKLKLLDYIEDVGIMAHAGDIIETPDMGNLSLSLFWFDKTEWEKLRVPAMSNIKGKYPQAYNEIMIPEWILKRMGITNPKIGMDIPIKYGKAGGPESEATSENFKLSAYYTEYSNLRSGNVGMIYVSKAFVDNKGITPENSGTATVRFKSNKNIGEQFEKLNREVTVFQTQKWKMVPLYETVNGDRLSTIIGLSGLILFIMLSSYLLIYNVLYISVSKDVRFYGLLKTVGTTPKQIRRIVTGQAIRLTALGVPLGLALGAAVSFVAVPFALSGALIDTGIKISFNPIIYIGAAVFSLVTTLISSIKPAGMAASISPIEAVRYTGTTVSCKLRKGSTGGKLQKMAFRNVFRNRRRAAVVFLSLFMGITTFMLVNTLVLSMDTENYVNSYMDNDFTLTNNTFFQNGTGIKQKFDNNFMSTLKGIEGIKEIRKVSQKIVTLKYDENLYKKHLEEFMKRFNSQMPTSDEIKKNPRLFWSNLVGLDTEYIKKLNKTLEEPIDVEAFEAGRIALFSTNNPKLFKVGSDIIFTADEKEYSLKLGGFLPERTAFNGGMGPAPLVYISNDYMKKLFIDPVLCSITMNAEADKEAHVLKQLKEMTANDNEISIESRLETLEQFKSSKTMLYILGGGISLILALIGILNFVNVMVTGVNTRRHEFAVLESIGMTPKQVKRMLSLEGLTYAIISCGLVATLGAALNIWIFNLFKKQADYAIFTFPTIPLILSVVIVFVVCILVPVAAYVSTTKDTVTERLRSVEG